MQVFSLILCFLFVASCSIAQQDRLAHLPKELKEISGLSALNDSLFFAINDSGNDACIYLINLKGEIKREISLKTAKNNDWEDLALDEKKEFLYIADVGNNLNKRKKLHVYKIRVADCFTGDEVESQRFIYSYPDQKAFPPSSDSMFYDCEAIAVAKDKIYFFTKDNSKPYLGVSRMYSMDTSGRNFKFEQSLEIGRKGYYQNSVTAADFHNDRFYLSTYSYIYVFKVTDGEIRRTQKVSYNRLTQKESLTVLNSRTIIVADEKSKLGVGQNIYKIVLKHD